MSEVGLIFSIVPLLVKIVLEYCQCADDLPNLVSEVMSKLIEILKVHVHVSISPALIHVRVQCITCIHTAPFYSVLLQFFNGRTCMLVLGAGAVETVGLKTITARHLGTCFNQTLLCYYRTRDSVQPIELP